MKRAHTRNGFGRCVATATAGMTFFAWVTPADAQPQANPVVMPVRQPASDLPLPDGPMIDAADCKPYLAEVEKHLKDAGLANEFRYHGVIDRADKIEFLRRLDVMSIPATYDEPKGVSLLEAMACGVPLVQPRRGGFTEICEKTGGGLLVMPDDPDALAQGILQIFRNKERAAELSANGFRGVRENYTSAHMADRLLQAYQSVLPVAKDKVA